ncbi:hypothetical protein ACXR2U_05195 [Jatrophihabitans sp. YIM 134969]
MSADQSPDFQIFVNRAVPMTSQPFVTVQKRGMLSINVPAYQLLGSPATVELMYDPVRRIVGVRAVDSAADHAYPVRSLSGREDGPFVVSATAFLKHFGITQPVSRRWVATVSDGVLQVDLRVEGTPVSSNRSRAHRGFGDPVRREDGGAAPGQRSG